MITPEYRRLHERVKAVQGDETKDAKYLAAILYTQVNPEQITDAGDIFWIKCSAKTQVGRLKPHYLASNYFEDVPKPSQAQFTANGQSWEEHTQMKDIDMFHDRIIVFQIVDKAKESGPLRASSGNASPYPTLAVDRHLSVPPPQTWSPALDSKSDIDALNHSTAKENLPTLSQMGHQFIKGEHSISPNQIETGNEDMARQAMKEQITSQIQEGKEEARGPHEHELLASNKACVYHRQNLAQIADLNMRMQEPIDGFEMNVANDSVPTGVNSQLAADQTPVPDSPIRSPSPECPTNDFLVTADSQSENIEQHTTFESTFLQQIVNNESLKLLEDATQAGVKVLDAIQGHLVAQASHPDAAQWLNQIDKLRKQLNRTRTVVGVVGNTGAGKSSVINALLDEERLVPTSCMRACTAVVTEISWNHSDDPSKKYRAEIEFISKAEWEKELKVLVKDIVDSNGEILREATSSSESDAGIAYSKMKAVYPSHTKEEFANSSVERLVNHPDIKKVLGKTRKIIDSDPNSFYKYLQQYVDSKEKSDDGKGKEKRKKGEKRQMEYWPLIKCVRIFTKSDALSTGAVLVDLPGVQDSNAARAAVADGYMKQCSGLWVVAPITRAVNDKAAKKLLSDQFKRQMKFDGMFSNLTFICSKTDDISITEAAEALAIDDEIQGSWDEHDRLEKELKNLRNDISDYQATQQSYQDVIDDCDDQVELWQDLEADLENGKKVFTPRTKHTRTDSKKRKRKSVPAKSRKRINPDTEADSDSVVSDADTESESESESEEDSDNESDSESSNNLGEPLTADEIRGKIDGIRAARKQARQDKLEVGCQIKEAKGEIKKLEKKIEQLKSEMSALCIAGRNEYSKGRIQEDFASGIKELDEETAIDEDEENFDPEIDLRDYEELARSLPVFCVSSRAYQKLSGRLKKDTSTPGFKTTEETGMPQLKAHCKKLTETDRATHSKIFLNALSQLLLSLSIWGSNDGTGVMLTEQQQKSEHGHAQRMLNDLDKALDKAARTCKERVKEALIDNIFNLCPAAHKEAQKAAIPIVQGWGRHKDMGGLVWSTYKAICRRDGGPFTGSRGSHDWNKQLTEPLEKVLVVGWEKCFQRCIPRETKTLAADMKRILQKSHQSVVERARKRGVGVVGVDLVSQKLATWGELFVNLANVLNALITEKQRDANRELTPVITAAMQRGYQLCVDESGPGSFNRMKGHMGSHINSAAQTMFSQATGEVWAQLETMFLEVSVELERQKEIIFTDMYKDYMNVLAGAQLPNGLMPKAERMMREGVVQEVRKTNNLFQRLLLGEALDEIFKGDDRFQGYGTEVLKRGALEDVGDDDEEAAEVGEAGETGEDIESTADAAESTKKAEKAPKETPSVKDFSPRAGVDVPMPDMDYDDSEDEDYQDNEAAEASSHSSNDGTDNEE